MIGPACVTLASVIAVAAAASIDVASLWDFSNPALSEERFRTALETADGDDALILQTQIARTYVLRKDFATARELLAVVEPKLPTAGAEAQVRYWLELGRTYASHQHPLNTQTDESRRLAREAFTRAQELAKDADLDSLAIDAVHMFAFVDTDPAEHLRRGQEALALVEASDQPEAKRWEASIRSTNGEALFELGRYDEALGYFRTALALREQGSSAQAIRDARWQIARVLRAQNRPDYRSKGDDERARYYADRQRSTAR